MAFTFAFWSFTRCYELQPGAWQHGFAELLLAAVRRSVDRCAYPDIYSGTWNMTETYLAPTILTRAHFFGADPSIANSTGNAFRVSPEDHGWYYAAEHVTGLTIDVSCGRHASSRVLALSHDG